MNDERTLCKCGIFYAYYPENAGVREARRPIPWAQRVLGIFIILLIVVPTICRAEILTASYYSIQSLKKEGTYAYSKGRMANNKFFTDEGATCACNTYPLGATLRVTNIENNKSVLVVVTDRTAKRFTGKRIDLAISQMRLLDGIKQGLVKVHVERI